MSLNTFFQLREADAHSKYGNGDFANNLIKPITLEEGDQVVLNKSIIDSRSVDSGKIVLKTDTNIKLSFCYYLVNYLTDGKTNFDGTAWTSADLDASYYILSDKHDPSGQDTIDFKKVTISSKGYFLPEPIPIVVSYIPVSSSVPTTRTLTLNAVNISPDFIVKWETTELDIIAIDDPSFQPPIQFITTEAQLDAYNFGFEYNTLRAVYQPRDFPGDIFEPVILSNEIQIPKGSYDPSDIAERISEKMTQLRQGDIFTTTNNVNANPFLRRTNEGSYTGLTDAFFIRSDGETHATSSGGNYRGAFKLTSSGGTDYFFGTSQLALAFDDIANRFEFTYTHMPLYNTGGDIEVKLVELGVGGQYQMVNAIGGILLTDLEASEVGTNNRISFWRDIGFNAAEVCVSFGHKDSFHLSAKVPFTHPALSLGTNLTGGEIGIDTLLTKQTPSPPEAPTFANTKATISASQTIQIKATGNFDLNNFSGGYFIVEVQMGLATELITNADIKSHVLGIVSRYYETQNYTIGNDSDAIIYEHRGSPRYCNMMRVRILDQNYNLAEVGNDNTLFFQVVKNPANLKIKDEEKEK